MKLSKSKLIATVATAFILLALFTSAFITEKAVDAYVQNTQLNKRSCIIIDAGHGGVDGGAVSCTGMEESQINLEIALRLNDLMHLLGINTKMIRMQDVSIYTKGDSIGAKKISDLKERVRIVNETEKAILVSIHQNYFEDSRYSGAQVFYNTDPELARSLQNALVKAINPGSRRKAKKANGVYLMDNINCSGILVECGFLSNISEEKLLQDATYQKKICCVIGSTLSSYLSKDASA